MKRQITLLVVAVTSLVTIAFVVPMAIVVTHQAADRSKVRLERRVESVGALVAISVDGGVEQLRRVFGDDTGLVFPDGSTIGAVDPSWDPVREALVGQSSSGAADGFWIVSIPVATSDGTLAVVGWVDADELSSGVAAAIVWLAAVGAMVNLAAVALANRLALGVTEPVNSLAAVARDLGSGNLAARAQPVGPSEVEAVGRALNDLASRLEEIIHGERESMADLSHRLRTPLTGLRLQAEQVEDEEVRASLLTQVDRLQAAVDRLISEVRGGFGGKAGGADLVAVARQRSEFWRVLADEEGREVVEEFENVPLVISATESDIGDVVDVLLGNVFAYTPPGTAYRIGVSQAGDTAMLVVADRGPGFRGEFDPLARGVSGGGSSGLGLDIARRLAERCGGSITLRNDGGAEVKLTFKAN